MLQDIRRKKLGKSGWRVSKMAKKIPMSFMDGSLYNTTFALSKLFCLGPNDFGQVQIRLSWTNNTWYFTVWWNIMYYLSRPKWFGPNQNSCFTFFLLLHYCGASEMKNHYWFCIKKNMYVVKGNGCVKFLYICFPTHVYNWFTPMHTTNFS